MPGSNDWKDYIPASGEASVNLGLKGKFGKGANMRRRFMRGGRRNTKFASYRGPRADKWWYTYLGENGDGETPINWDDGGSWNTPQVVVSLSGSRIAADQFSGGSGFLVRGSNEVNVRWIGRDGTIPITLTTQQPNDGTPSDPGTLRNTWATVLYAWFKFHQDFSNTLPGNIGTQFPMRPDENLRSMLARKDIIRWGFVDIPRQMNRQEEDLGASISLANMPGPRPRAFIPFPRFPRGGFKMTSRELLMCIVQPCSADGLFTAELSAGYTGNVLRCFPMFRCLMAG